MSALMIACDTNDVHHEAHESIWNRLMGHRLCCIKHLTICWEVGNTAVLVVRHICAHYKNMIQ